MRADELDVNGSGSERNGGYQAVAVAFDIENETLVAHMVGSAKRLTHGGTVSPFNGSYMMIPSSIAASASGCASTKARSTARLIITVNELKPETRLLPAAFQN
jgi:hypothetical protein